MGVCLLSSKFCPIYDPGRFTVLVMGGLEFFSCMSCAIMFHGKGEMRMSPALMKMWISFVAMGFMFISVLTVYFTRFKIKNSIVRGILNTIAFLLIVLAGLIIFYVVFSGPVPEQ
jgi:hypothetical protein